MDGKTTEKGIVLLVDDNPTNLGVLFESLSGFGFKLLAAQDGESAIAQVTYLKPDVILLDVMMPGIDGFETCRRLKANPETRDIPIIFMTALTETIDKVKGFEVGALDYITKPFQPEEVLARINAHLAIQRLQQQLQAQNQQLQQEIRDRKQAEQSLRFLLHAVSHDLRNPVTGMLMVLKNLLKAGEAEGTEEAGLQSIPYSLPHPPCIPVPRSILERMVESGDRQLNLINSLLEAHTIEIHGMELHCEPMQLSTLVTSIVQDLQPLLAKNQATLVNQVPKELPLISGDPTQLWRVVENLVGNALKHNPPGLSLSISARVEDNYICCCITDNGVGIPPDQSTQLFELYKRGINARHTHGLGLGLYLCRQIIIAHGGNIGVESHSGKGSTFWFTVPLQTDSMEHPANNNSKGSVPTPIMGNG
jgi:two-component system sensor histidine kinase/response regulator